MLEAMLAAILATQAGIFLRLGGVCEIVRAHEKRLDNLEGVKSC